MRRSHRFACLVLWMALLALGAACAAPSTDQPSATSTVAEVVETLPPTATFTPEPTNTPWPTLIAPATATPLPNATPLPTPGAIQPAVGLPPLEDKPCENSDYPCFDDVAEWEARIVVPDGFSAEYFALIPDNPTSLTFGPNDLLFVATMTGTIHTIDAAGTVSTLFQGDLRVPVGTAYEPNLNRLYVSDRIGNDEARVGYIDLDTLTHTVIFDGVPCCYAGMHAANGMDFGPDGNLYIAIGAAADHGEILDTDEQAELHPWEASILKVSLDGENIENYARGIRNAYDIAWDASGRLFATNNGPDFGPPDTLYQVIEGGEHGYPWYVCDNCFGPAPEGVELVAPVHEFIPHSAPTGVAAYLNDAFPGYYNSLFAVLWSAFEGAQKIVRFLPGATDSADFATGFAAPIDVEVSAAGDLYVADWATGIIFKISYVGE